MSECAKICKNCKHFQRDVPLFWHLSLAKCAAPELGIDLVTGKPWKQFATITRGFERLCGSSAKWYQPK